MASSSSAGLVDKHRLKAPLQRLVFLYIFAVFVERSRAYRVQFSPGKHRFKHIAGVHRAFGGSRAYYRVQFIYKEYDVAAVGDLF